MKMATKVLAVWGCIATLLLFYLLGVYLDSEGIAQYRSHPHRNYYYPASTQDNELAGLESHE